MATAVLCACLLPAPAFADSLVTLGTRPGATVPVYCMKRENAQATVVLLPGGADPSSDPCGPPHRHGHIGMEKKAVAPIAAWIRRPAP